jgi:putative holliday junction resolvase
MGRIIAIDYGKKRTGLAVTDPFQIIATGLTTVPTPELMTYLKNYVAKESVELILMGMPTNWDDSDTTATPLVRQAIGRLRKAFPDIPLETADERYTSRMATQSMLESGLKKKDRRNKALVDEIAATILLQDYLRARTP